MKTQRCSAAHARKDFRQGGQQRSKVRQLVNSPFRSRTKLRWLLVVTLASAWLPLVTLAQGASTVLQVVDAGKPAVNNPVLALINAGKVRVGTTASDGSVDVPGDVAAVEAGTPTAVYRDCEDELLLVPEGERVETAQKEHCNYDLVGVYRWGQTETVLVEFSLGLTASALGAVQVAVEHDGQIVTQARVTIYRHEMVVTSRGADAAGMALIPLEEGEYTLAVRSGSRTVRHEIAIESEVVTSFTADPSRGRCTENERPFGRYRPVDTSKAERDYAVYAAEVDGLLSVRVESPFGNTFLAFPAYVVPGETVTWSARPLPEGATDEELEEHRVRLSQQVIAIDDQRYALATSTHWTMEARASAKVSFAAGERGKTQVEFQLSLVTRQTSAPTRATTTPLSALAGWPLRIPGSFDGLAKTTTVTFAGAQVELLAESSSAAFFNPPNSALGVQTIEVTEAGNPGGQLTVRNTGLELSVDNNRLWTGESTPLHLRALGLQGITRPMFLVLINRTIPVISMTRGNYQCWVILPDDVIDTGEVAYERAVRGTKRGVFFIDALLMPL